ncbi:MAG: High affinity branched-chain amino acid ABC transporter, ATP-binding protein, partial [Parcubacteria group bacterium GW2011_GWC1_40_13]
GFAVKDKNELKRRIEEVVEMFPDLKAKIKTKAGTLSGGQQQMLALARGLMADPKILLLDEPSLGLAPKLVKEVFAKIKEINEKHKVAIMVVEHNIKSLLNIAHRVYLLDKGKVVFSGNAQEVIGEKAIQKFFLNTEN